MFKLIHVGKNWDGGQGKLKSSWLPARASGLTLMVNCVLRWNAEYFIFRWYENEFFVITKKNSIRTFISQYLPAHVNLTSIIICHWNDKIFKDTAHYLRHNNCGIIYSDIFIDTITYQFWINTRNLHWVMIVYFVRHIFFL